MTTTTTSGLIHCQLWMGGLEPYMTESFVMAAFQRMGEQPQNVKVMRNKYTGEPAGYCFVHFATDEAALDAMHKLSGKIIPNTQPAGDPSRHGQSNTEGQTEAGEGAGRKVEPIRFKLNHASTTGRPPLDREFSLWVGDLTSDVDDYTLYRTFASRYPSIRTAKVILDNVGFSKGYGFIRFANEEEQKLCLTQMNGYKGLGSKAIKISNAVPKPHRVQSATNTVATTPTTSSTGYSSSQDYSQYYDPSYWQNYSAWHSYYDTSSDPNAAASMHMGQASIDYSQSSGMHISEVDESTNPEDDLELVEHNLQPDVERLNKELTDRDYNFWDALENSKWLPVEGLECN